MLPGGKKFNNWGRLILKSYFVSLSLLFYLRNSFGVLNLTRSLNCFFWYTRAGKTTVAAWYAKMYNKKHIPVYSNVAIKNTYHYDPADELGKLKIQGPALIILDEASVEFNNRSWKTFPAHLIKWFKYHRHFSCEVAVFSQDYSDFDATIKRLTYRMFLLRKSKIPFFVKLIPIKRSIGINDQTKNLMIYMSCTLGTLHGYKIEGYSLP